MGNKNSGPRRKPNHLQLLRGVTRKDRLNPAEPKPPKGEAVKPVALSVGAAVVWDETAPMCAQMGTLTPADQKAFASFCEMQASFTQNALRKDSDPEHFSSRAEIDLASKLRPYYDYFGLTAQGRARIVVPKTKAEEPASKWAGALK